MATVLYRSWRSRTFGDLLGQEAIAQTLRHAVAAQRVAHAYLFSGPRGTGKTSAARLLAMLLNCEAVHDGEPCGTCATCVAIVAGASRDVTEIDAASNRGIDDVRHLRDLVQVVPPAGRTRVVILDEAHMLTPEAFNALLKTLEEPPPRVVFILATTEAQKIPATVASRCQPFVFRRIDLPVIRARLAQVARAEDLTVDADALDLLARAAGGGMRDALSLLDQARAYCADAITGDALRGMLGMASGATLSALLAAVQLQDTAAALHLVTEALHSGVALEQLGKQIADRWRQIVLTLAGADVAQVLDLSAEAVQELHEQAAPFTLATATTIAHLWSDLVNLPAPRAHVVAQLPLELALLASIDAQRAQAPVLQDARVIAFPPAVAAPVTPVAAAPHPVEAPPRPAPVARAAVPVAPPPAKSPASARPAPLAAFVVPPAWHAIIRQAQQMDHLIAGLLRLVVPVMAESNDRAVLWLSPISAFAAQRLALVPLRQQIATISGLVLQKPCDIVVLAVGEVAPTDLDLALPAVALATAVQTDEEVVMADPLARFLIERTGASWRRVTGPEARALLAGTSAPSPLPDPAAHNTLGEGVAHPAPPLAPPRSRKPTSTAKRTEPPNAESREQTLFG